MNGFVVLNKAQGVTSFKAAAALRRIFSEKKTGHTGTLDPMASGVLPVALGKATRFIDFIPCETKGYKAKFRFGITTDTLDITGNVLTETACDIKREDILAVLDEFRGDIMQLPPMYSAISKNGVRLYELARKGIEVEREKRAVTIFELALTDYENDGEFELDVICSKGTYIRTLIADIGERLGVGAVMTALHRTVSNGFTKEQAKTVEEIEKLGETAVLGVDFPFMCYPAVKVTDAQGRRFCNGGELFSDRLHIKTQFSLYRVYSQNGEFLGLGEISEDCPELLRVKRVVGNNDK